MNALYTLGTKVNRLELAWIKAHNNCWGNERADELAKNSMYNSIGYFDIRPPLSYTKSQLRNMVVSLWHTNWVTTKTCSLTKKLYPTYNASKARELSRKYSRRLIEIISGQNNLHYVQNKINHTSNLCRLSEEEEETFDNFVN